MIYPHLAIIGTPCIATGTLFCIVRGESRSMPMLHHIPPAAVRRLLTPPTTSRHLLSCQFLRRNILPAAVISSGKQWQNTSKGRRHLHQTCARSTFRPVWTERRVKVPWVEALAKKREEEARLRKMGERGGEKLTRERDSTVKVDLTPKKMSDTYFRTVS